MASRKEFQNKCNNSPTLNWVGDLLLIEIIIVYYISV